MSDLRDMEIVCRCEDVIVDEVRALIRQGYTSVDEVKRLLRIGMGPCQGRTCGSIIQQEIARLTGVPIDNVPRSRLRPPARSVRLGVIAASMEEGDR